MDLEIENKLTLVTGSKAGIGYSIAEMIHYGMTKTTQIGIARGLAEATDGTGITVNSVLPGPTRSRGVNDFVGELAKQEGKSFEESEKEFFEKVIPTSLIKRG